MNFSNFIYYLLLALPLIIILILTYNNMDSIIEHLYNYKGIIILTIILIILSIFYFDSESLEIKKEIRNTFGLTRSISGLRIFTCITSNFIHSHYLHILMNLTSLAFFWFIERDYGYIFIFIMFLIPAIISDIIMSFIIPENTILIGASAGLFSLFSILISENLIINNDYIPISNISYILEIFIGLIIIIILAYFYSSGARYSFNKYSFFSHLFGSVGGYILYSSLKNLFPNLFDFLIRIGKY